MNSLLAAFTPEKSLLETLQVDDVWIGLSELIHTPLQVNAPAPTSVWQYLVAVVLLILTAGACLEVGLASQVGPAAVPSLVRSTRLDLYTTGSGALVKNLDVTSSKSCMRKFLIGFGVSCDDVRLESLARAPLPVVY
jgi:hypothetical protein